MEPDFTGFKTKSYEVVYRDEERNVNIVREVDTRPSLAWRIYNRAFLVVLLIVLWGMLMYTPHRWAGWIPMIILIVAHIKISYGIEEDERRYKKEVPGG